MLPVLSQFFGALIAIYVILVSLWVSSVLDQHLLNISRVDTLTKVILVTSQLLSVSALAGLGFLVQATASDQSIRRSCVSPLLLGCEMLLK